MAQRVSLKNSNLSRLVKLVCYCVAATLVQHYSTAALWDEMKVKYNSIAELVAILEAQKDELSERILALKKSSSSFDEELIFKYIETRSTVKVAEYAKSKGVKSPKGTVFSAGDVSALIKEGSCECVDPALMRIAQDIFEKNTKAVVSAYG